MKMAATIGSVKLKFFFQRHSFQFPKVNEKYADGWMIAAPLIFRFPSTSLQLAGAILGIRFTQKNQRYFKTPYPEMDETLPPTRLLAEERSDGSPENLLNVRLQQRKFVEKSQSLHGGFFSIMSHFGFLAIAIFCNTKHTAKTWLVL